METIEIKEIFSINGQTYPTKDEFEEAKKALLSKNVPLVEVAPNTFKTRLLD